MRIVQTMSFLALLICCSAAAIPERHFAGKWQGGSNPKTGKSAIVVNLVRRGHTFTGSLIFTNPDGTHVKSAILKPELIGNVLKFQTYIEGTEFDWLLTLEEGGRAGMLHGSDHRSARGGKAEKWSLTNESQRAANQSKFVILPAKNATPKPATTTSELDTTAQPSEDSSHPIGQQRRPTCLMRILATHRV